MVQILVFIILVLFFAVLLGFIARKRGADPFFWTIMGGLFGPFAIPFVFLVKSSKRKRPKSNKT